MNFINNKKLSNKGFTIVELLIVIVVIGILAAIVIVAYNGVQNSANATKNQANAKEVVNKAEVYAAMNDGTYPTLSDLTGAEASDTFALSSTVEGLLVAPGASTGPAEARKSVVGYAPCGTGNTGANVTYWTYGVSSHNGTANIATLRAGNCS